MDEYRGARIRVCVSQPRTKECLHDECASIIVIHSIPMVHYKPPEVDNATDARIVSTNKIMSAKKIVMVSSNGSIFTP
jgi:hypothetical protein